MKNVVVAIDLGGTRCKLGLFHNNTLKDQIIFPSYKEKSTAHNLHLVVSEIVNLCKKNGWNKNAIHAIGLAFPGLVDRITSTVISCHGKYEDAHLFDFENWSHSTFSCPILMENDARLACLGEHRYGAGLPFSDMVMVTFGTGVGTSVIQNNKLLIGKHFQAGCLGGHFPVNVAGRACHCGNKGCLEAESSLEALHEYAEQLASYPESSLSGKPFDFKALMEAYKVGDKAAIEVVNYACKVWATGLIAFIHAYDPEAIVLGGGIMKSHGVFLPLLRKYVQQHAWTPSAPVRLVVGELDEGAAMYGALALICG